MSILVGTTLNGRYRLEARIAAGGMSTVYRALDETLERQVAVKLMNREVASDSDQLERFRREARAVAQLSHPHVVGVIDAGEDDGRPYIVLEYVEGATLKERIRSEGRLAVDEAIAYAIEVAQALGAAHDRHIVHRDVKPQNVLIDGEGSAKVTDFGIARTLEEQGLTADGRVLGTTDYVSPEQALGHPVTGQSDLYSLGIVLYEMLTGEVPFHGENQVAVAMKHVREEIPDVQLKRPEISAALAAVVETSTAKRETDRYADASEMIADLEEVLSLETARAGSAGDQATTVLRALPREQRRRVPLRLRAPWLVALLALVVAAVVAIALVFLAGNTHHGTGTLAQKVPTGSKQQISLCNTCAVDYNPYALDGSPTTQNSDLDGYAIDNDPNTAWRTDIYYDNDQLGKPGVGLYVKLNPGAAATSMVLDTKTPGYTVEIEASTGAPNPNTFSTASGAWKVVGSASGVSAHQTIHLTTHDIKYKYYLVWITSLGDHDQVAVNEIALYTGG